MARFNITVTTDTQAAKALVGTKLAYRKSNGLKATVLQDDPRVMVIEVDDPQVNDTITAAAFASDFAGMNPHLMASAVMCT